MLNLIKYVKRMKKLLFFAILALFMCSCEEVIKTGELYIVPTGKNEIYYWINTTGENWKEVTDGYTRTPIYIELPVGEYRFQVLHNDYFQNPMMYHQNNIIRIRDGEVTTINVLR
jgi:hypothetical protein